MIVLQNIISNVDIFPFPKTHIDHVNHETKNILWGWCFVNFSCGDAVLLLFFCGIAVFRAPQCPLEQ